MRMQYSENDDFSSCIFKNIMNLKSENFEVGCPKPLNLRTINEWITCDSFKGSPKIIEKSFPM